jgi:hypothetical protein
VPSKTYKNKGSTVRAPAPATGRGRPSIGGIKASRDLPTIYTLKAATQLARKKIGPPLTKGVSIEDITRDTLAAIDITIREDIKIEYSLLNIEDGQKYKLLPNKDIVDPRLKILENSPQNPTVDKFPNSDDPFYELDEASPEFRVQQRETLKAQNGINATKIMADLYNMNSRRSKSLKIKQFN